MAGEIKVRTLSVQELIEYVYSFTTDNGSNMIKLRKLIADAQRVSSQKDDGDVSDHLDRDLRATSADHVNDRTEFLAEILFDDEDWDDENETFDVIEVIEIISQADTERNDVLEKTKKDELKTKAITSKLTGACITCGSMEVIGIRCGSHTLQLVVDDAKKKVAHLNSIINKGHAAAV